MSRTHASIYTLVTRHADEAKQAVALLERWHAIRQFLAKEGRPLRRVVWSCVPRLWIYELWAEVDYE